MTSSSIDPNEVAYYEKLGNMWWDTDGILWPLHRLNGLRTDFLKEHICRHFNRDKNGDKPLHGLRVLDIGCGGGILSESIAALGADVHGIDVTEKNITVARQHNEKMPFTIRYEHITAEELANRKTQYDVVLNMEVVEHVLNLPGFMAACTKLLNEEGMMFISTINRTWKSWLFAIVGAEYILRWLPKGTHQWKKFVRPEELDEILTNNNMQSSHYTGVRINPFSKKFSLTSNLKVNYMLAATCRH